MIAENISMLNYKLRRIKKKREKINKVAFTVDKENNEIKLRLSSCTSLFCLSLRLVVFLEQNKSEEKRMASEHTKAILIQYMGITDDHLKKWKEEGVSLSDFEKLMFCLRTPSAVAISQIYLDLGREKFFKGLFRGFIHPKVFDLPGVLDFPPLVFKPTEKPQPEHPKPVTVKSSTKRLKRYRPEYEALPRHCKEYAISLRLQAELGGFREVSTPSGNIDLLTAYKLIELKAGERWTHGIGQLIAYGFHHPDKQKILYLFDYDNLDLDNVRAVCQSANIEVMLEP
jgi:hypothetical protein